MGLIFRTEKEEQEEEDQKRSLITTTTTGESCNLLLWFREHTGETTHRVVDPINRTMRTITLPELNVPLQCLSSNHGWLLLLSRKSSKLNTPSSLFFFNPFTRARIDLPSRPSLFDAAAFSAPPTSPECVVYAVEKPFLQSRINVDVLRVGDHHHHRQRPSWRSYRLRTEDFATVKAAVASNSRLWCMDCLGRVGVFENGVWRVVCGKKSGCVGRRGFGGLVEMGGGGEIGVGVRGERGLGGMYMLKKKNSGNGGGNGDDEEEEEEEVMEWEEMVVGGESNVMYMGGCGGSVVVVEGVKGEVFWADEGSGMCCVYKREEGCVLKRVISMGNSWLGQHCTPVWIQKSV